MSRSGGPSTRVVSAVELGPFSYRWPASTERFERGWEGVAEFDGRPARFRHGLGRRVCFGRERVHTVTWLSGQPVVEGAEAEDYARSRSVVSVVKAEGRDVREAWELPAGYDRFDVVVHRDEVVGPFARRSLAVKLREDDLDAWLLHAWLRLASRRRPSRPPAPRPPAPAPPRAGAVVAALLAFGATAAERTLEEPSFTPDRDANRFVIEDPFAFLVAVVCDQGIVAERAWQAPWELRRRLGHLDPSRLAAEPESVRAAVQQPPKLHRYVEIVPRWIVSAARRLVSDYGGDADRIWGDRPTATELRRRLEAFDGIGQKKAAMAVEILERDLGVEVRELHGSDIAYDVHVRRVLLRTGLAERDDREHMLDVARRAHPDRPGAIDYPAWLVGRQWCHAGTPDCPACVLEDVCPKDVARASVVRGA